MKRKFCNAAKIAGGYCIALLMAFYTVWCVVMTWRAINEIGDSASWECIGRFVGAVACVCLFVCAARQLGKTFWIGLWAEQRGFGLDGEVADRLAVLGALRRACDEIKWIDTMGDEDRVYAALFELNKVCDLLEGKK